MNDIPASLRNALAMPLTHIVVTSYASGKFRTHETRNAASAENYAIGERRKVGRALIDRETGNTVEVTSVSVTTHAELSASYVALVGYDPLAEGCTVQEVVEMLSEVQALHNA